MAETVKQARATSEEELRYSSRKWILTKWSMALYTAVHLLNAGVLLVARYKDWIDTGALQPLWSSSLSTWSLGVGAIIAMYFGANVVQKRIAPPTGGE